MDSRVWFRSEKWDTAIEAKFLEKLGRAKDPAHCLCVQAAYLAPKYPDVALGLLKLYFSNPDEFSLANAYLIQATAYLALGEVETAVESLLKALQMEREYRGVRTTAWTEFVMLVASWKLESHFRRAHQILREHKSSANVLQGAFVWHALSAMVFSSEGKTVLARKHAKQALDAGKRSHSTFRYKSRMGPSYAEIWNQMFRLSSGKP